VLCHNDSTFSHNVQVDGGWALMREQCVDVATVHDTSRTDDGPNVAYTDVLWDAQRAFQSNPGSTNPAGLKYGPDTSRGGVDDVLTPFGPAHPPELMVNSGGKKLLVTRPIPIARSEGGSDFIWIDQVDNPDPGSGPPKVYNYQMPDSGQENVGGYPRACIGNCGSPGAGGGAEPHTSGATRLDDYFAKSYEAFVYIPCREGVSGSWCEKHGSWTTSQRGSGSSSTPHRYKLSTGKICVGGTNFGRACTDNGDCPGASCQNAAFDNREINTDLSEAPQVRPANVAKCDAGEAALCEEMPFEGMTVNEQVAGDVISASSRIRVEIRMYAYAHSDHMAIRRRIMDYGDGSPPVNAPGFYKNHRGLKEGASAPFDQTERYCGSTETDWGLVSQACDHRYFLDVKTYTCTPQLIAVLPTCGGTDRPYPCKVGTDCHFRPRVQFLDNWGLCNGACPGGPATDACFNTDLNPETGHQPLTDVGDINDPIADRNECYDLTSGPNARHYNLIGGKRPWTEYQGDIVVPSVD
jgi:hypothetical protein